MKFDTKYIIIFVLLFLLAGCKEEKSSTNTSLDAESFQKAINEPSEKIILDVRTPEEFNEGHIRNALLINFRDDRFKDEVGKLDKEIPVYVYCASGVRSDKAATVMKEQGFKKVYVLEKGLNEWTDSKKELVQ